MNTERFTEEHKTQIRRAIKYALQEYADSIAHNILTRITKGETMHLAGKNTFRYDLPDHAIDFICYAVYNADAVINDVIKRGVG